MTRPVTSERATTATPAIEASDLTKRFGLLTVLEGVTFALEGGSKTALLGANGAGKSTLLDLLSTLSLASGGSGRVAGFDLATQGVEVRRRVGVLGHRPMLYEQLTSIENLEFFARLYEVAPAATRIEELLRAVGLWRRRDERVEVLSRGFHQRLAIARALVHAPPVLLLDEPETGLDESALALLDELMLRAPDVTVLAATHRRDRIERWADGTIEVARGRLVEASGVAPGTSR